MKTKTFIVFKGLGFVILTLACILNARAQQPQYTTNFMTVAAQSSIPFNNSLNNKAQWVYLPSDFPTAPSGYMSTIYFKAAPSMLPVVNAFSGFTVKMGQTNLSILPPGPWITANMNTVFYMNTFNVWPIQNDWIPVTLQTPFYYDGTCNFIVEASQVSYSVGFDVMQAAYTARSLYGNIGSVMANTQNYLVGFGFDLTQGSTDAAVQSFVGLTDTLCAGPKPITITLKNNGPSTMTSATINWKVNNVSQPVFNWAGTLVVNSTTNATLGNYTFQPGLVYTIEAVISNPNNLPDNNPSNDTLNYTIGHVKPFPAANPISNTYQICPGDTAHIGINLLGTAPWNLTISNGSVNFNYNIINNSPLWLDYAPTTSTTYTIMSVTDASGCPFSGQPSIYVQVNPGANVNLGPDKTLKYTHSTTLTAGIGYSSYLWSTGDTTSSINVQGSTLGMGTHTFSVTVTNSYGCSDVDSINVIVIDDVGMTEVPVGPHMLVLPNPARDRVEVVMTNIHSESVNVILYDFLGRPVSKIVCPATSDIFKVILDVSNYSPGIYFIQVATEVNKQTRKLILY